jgi:uncharacterized membrane protein
MGIAILALLGMFDALYLGLERTIGGAVYCPTGGGCETVAASSYSVLFDILPVAYLGVFGYALLFGMAILALSREMIGRISISVLLLGISTIGVACSAYFVFLQLAIINAICFWCMLSAVLQLLIWVAALINMRSYQATRVDSSRSLAL